MARTPYIPPKLTKGPFTLEEARAAGLTLSALTSKAWRRLGAELYCWAQLQEDPWQLLSAWQRSLPAEAVFAGGTAAWLFGLDVEPIDPVEIVVPPESGIRPRVGLTVRRCELLPAEIVSIRGLCATALPFTLAGLCLRRPAVEALVAIDMRCGPGSPMRLHWVATPRPLRAAMVQGGCVRWPRLRLPPNRRWKRGSVGF
jgi:hypothetical protein